MPFIGQNFQVQSALIPNSPLVERSHIYERVQLVEYYQIILVRHLDHSGNTGGAMDKVSGDVYHQVARFENASTRCSNSYTAPGSFFDSRGLFIHKISMGKSHSNGSRGNNESFDCVQFLFSRNLNF